MPVVESCLRPDFSIDIDTVSVEPSGLSHLIFDLSGLPSVMMSIEFRIYFYHAPEPGGDFAHLASTAVDQGATGLEIFGSLTPTARPPQAELPPLRTFTIQAGATKLIPGRMSMDPKDNAPDPNGGIVEADTIRTFAIAGLLDSVHVYPTLSSHLNISTPINFQVDASDMSRFITGEVKCGVGNIIGLGEAAEWHRGNKCLAGAFKVGV